VRIADLRQNATTIGREIHDLMTELYPICRSITGDGVRQTLDILRRGIPLEVHEVPSGTAVFDWTIPKEWNIRDAYVRKSTGERVIDFKRSNLHVLSYSVPVHTRMSLAELKHHLFTAPEQPDAIPYRTSYFTERWGFCLSHRQLLELTEDEYEVCIDSSLEAGHLTYGEYFLPGASDDEVLISCHVCHPSLANDNLSGMAMAALLAQCLTPLDLRHSYRFLFIPGTIGSITWLSRNEERVSKIKHGLVVACVGDSGPSTYKKSRRGNAEIDRAVSYVLRLSGQAYRILEFSPYGYDERQYCSPGFDLPVGCFMRTPHGQFPEYHTSADNLDFVRPAYVRDSFIKLISVLDLLEGNKAYRNRNPKCEPQLGKRNLYRTVGGQEGGSGEVAMLWVLSLSDGSHTLLDIAERSGLAFEAIRIAADALFEHGLLVEETSPGRRPCVAIL
jgi:aminopeptidase-like protein